MPKNPHTSFRLSGEGRELLALLGKFYGLSMTAVLELLIRERADQVAQTRPVPDAASEPYR